MITERIKKIRDESVLKSTSLSVERSLLITEYYENILLKKDKKPASILRGGFLEYFLRKKALYIHPQELIVGERGERPKATPTYPEICLHSLDDLAILNNREKVPYQVSDKMRQIYQERIIPFWKGKSNRERVMQSMSPEWHQAYKAGIFTEFQEQRAPGHTAGGSKIFEKGLLDLNADIKKRIKELSEKPHLNQSKIEALQGMRIAADAMILYAERHAKMLEELSVAEVDLQRKQELAEMAEICKKVPANRPETFHEALQHYWFIHLGIISEVNPWDSFSPGRLDQHLYPFYKKDIQNGKLTREKAIELLQNFWVKFNNQPAPPKIGVTAEESNTYTDFALINLGGLTSEGEDAVNELSMILLDVIEEMRILQPSSMIQVSTKSPDEFIHRAIKIIKTGFGQPSVFNSDMIIKELTRQGKDVEDARNGGASGCVESGAFGKECYILTGYLNLPKILEITLHNGMDPLTGEQIGRNDLPVNDLENFEEFFNVFKCQLEYFIDIKINGNLEIERLFAENIPVPFLSLFIDDCISKGIDYNNGGAKYNTSYLQGVGLGTITDALTSIKYHVFDKQSMSINKLVKIMDRNYIQFEKTRFSFIYQTPKYGNDDAYADQQAKDVFNAFFEFVDGRRNFKNGFFRINMLPTTSHVYFGRKTGALPDGRKSGEPISEGISPVQGMDTKGPTAALFSASKIDHEKTGGTLLNMKFAPNFFNHENALQNFTALIRTYFHLGGHHIQFNVVSVETLRDAQEHPEKYRDLIVRVAGYSDYFNNLTPDLQNEIINRSMH